MAKITKLGIGMPTSGLVEARTAFSLITAMQFVEVPMQLFLGIGCYIHQSRDIIARQAMENGCSHLLLVDTDVLFNHDAITRLMAHDLDVVGVKCNKRALPSTPIIKDDIKELSKVPFVGAGLLLINMNVFKKIGKPYFSFDDKAESDDVYFCNKVIKNKLEVWCDPTIQVGYIATAIY